MESGWKGWLFVRDARECEGDCYVGWDLSDGEWMVSVMEVSYVVDGG